MICMNAVAYLIYLVITYLITVKVGWVFYRNGRIFILGLLQGDAALTGAINNILLAGYYLLNLGYATLMISTWDKVHNWTEMLVSITRMTGIILLTLAVMHVLNMLTIYFISKARQHPLHHTKS